MTLDTFKSICMHRGITLDEGYALYSMYRTGIVGPPQVDEHSLLKLIDKGLYSRGHLCEELKDEFRIAEIEFGDGSKYRETMQMNDNTVKVTEPVRRKELAIIPILDTLMEGLYNILVSETIKQSSLHKDILKKATMYFNQDMQLTKYFLVWYYLWPTSNVKLAGPWETLFQVNYNGVNLRSCTEGKLREFKETARLRDVRIYVLSTYLFIKSGISEDGRTYIKKYENFVPVKDEIFNFTVDLIDELKENLPVIFDKGFLLNGGNQRRRTESQKIIAAGVVG